MNNKTISNNNNDILVLTNTAVQHIKSIMSRRGSGIGFRVSIKKTGCSGYMYVPEIVDSVKEGDIKVDTNTDDLQIFIDPQCVEIIRGSTLDLVTKSLGAKQLQFNNPNVEGMCGCGESFHLKEDKNEKEDNHERT